MLADLHRVHVCRSVKHNSTLPYVTDSACKLNLYNAEVAGLNVKRCLAKLNAQSFYKKSIKDIQLNI